MPKQWQKFRFHDNKVELIISRLHTYIELQVYISPEGQKVSAFFIVVILYLIQKGNDIYIYIYIYIALLYSAIGMHLSYTLFEPDG
jgi:hypothetical protein